MRIDRRRTPRDLLPTIERTVRLCRPRRSARSRTRWHPADGTPVFTVEGRYRHAAGPSGRRASSSAPRSCSSTPPATRAFLEIGRARGRSSGWRRTSPTSACTITASTTSAPTAICWRLMREGRIRRQRVGARLLRAGAQGQRRGAGRPLDAPAGPAGTSTRSTARTRCSSTRSARCAPWRRATCSGHVDGRERRSASACSSGSSSTRAPTAHFNVFYGTRPRPLTTSAAASRTRASSTPQRHAIAARARSRATRRSRTWTRGLAWAMLGFAEQLEFLDVHARRRDLDACGGRGRGRRRSCWRRGARDLRLLHRRSPPPTASRTGTPARRAWRRSATGAIGAADPFNDHEPVDSSAAAIAAQGLLRLGACSAARGADGERYTQAGLHGARHAVRRAVPERRPRAPGPAAALGVSPAERLGPRAARPRRCRAASRACGATTTLREAALYVKRLAEDAPYLTFFGHSWLMS